MARLSVELEPREEDWNALLRFAPGQFDADLFCGRVKVQVGTSAMTIGKLHRTPSDTGDPFVMLAGLLSDLLTEGLALLTSKRRFVYLGLADSVGLTLRREGGRVRLRIGKVRPRRTLLDLGKELLPEPLVSATVSDEELGLAIVEASTSLLTRLEEERPDLVREDPFWSGIRRRTDEMKSWLDTRAGHSPRRP